MKQFEIIPHTADVCIRVFADTLPELFVNALEGMNHIIKEGFCADVGRGEIVVNIEVHAADETALLVDFLSTVLSTAHTKEAVFCRAELDELQSGYLRGRIYGNRTPDGFDEDIKAVTYHDAKIERMPNGLLQTRIVFDI